MPVRLQLLQDTHTFGLPSSSSRHQFCRARGRACTVVASMVRSPSHRRVVTTVVVVGRCRVIRRRDRHGRCAEVLVASRCGRCHHVVGHCRRSVLFVVVVSRLTNSNTRSVLGALELGSCGSSVRARPGCGQGSSQ